MKTKQLIVFSDDWGRHPSSCQHLVRRLLPDCEVTWVNTIGTRPVRFDWTTLKRGTEKIVQWAFAPKQPKSTTDTEPSPKTLNPLMWPSFSSPWNRRLNRKLLSRALKKNIVDLKDAVVLTTIPITADLVDAVEVDRWVYYCVDDFSVWPGLDSQTLAMLEKSLIQKVDHIVTAGSNLASLIKEQGKESTIISHGVDLEHWTNSATDNPPELFQDLEKPLAVFWGLIDQRLDLEYLQALSDSMTEGTVVLVGPQQNPSPELEKIPRLHCTGPVDYNQLPQIAEAADVLIMPYIDAPVTRAMQPLKLKEYLATGKPVVARDLPSVDQWADCLDVAQTPQEFAAAVNRRFTEKPSDSQVHARKRLLEEGWNSKAEQLKIILFD
ncbi:MAG: hypothetical protein COA78_31995 [Blastopirellula sp.]|nr:MAG: hypothetical protein COA78_31995 [Blastopirellula sp.]